jgi:hypothetical protein
MPNPLVIYQHHRKAKKVFTLPINMWVPNL